MQQQPKAPTAEQQLALEISPLKYGTVVNVPRDKQYGFIYTPGIEKNIFFHASNMADCEFQDIEEGKEVRFRLMYAKQGYFAEEITMMD
ncbi:MAG: cold shock domain-containing protein [Reinekea sp.]